MVPMRRRVFNASGDGGIGPEQSIYGFRGASDGQIFSLPSFSQPSGRPLFLSIAWRNDISVLNAANHVAEKAEGGSLGACRRRRYYAAQVPDPTPACLGGAGLSTAEQAAARMVGALI